jgi:hypothetical protein
VERQRAVRIDVVPVGAIGAGVVLSHVTEFSISLADVWTRAAPVEHARHVVPRFEKVHRQSQLAWCWNVRAQLGRTL